MKCSEIEIHLGLLPDETNPSIMEEISRHIASCDKCRKIAKQLSAYRHYAESAEEAKASDNFELNVLKRVSAVNKPSRKKSLYIKFGFALSSAALLLITILLFKPREISSENIVETTFALKAKKKDKGPADAVYFRNIDNALKAIVSETGSEIAEYKSNSVTGYYDYITVSVHPADISDFVEAYNSVSAAPINIPLQNDMEPNNVHIKIYIAFANFALGDFNGDKHTDIIAQFLSGKRRGIWILYKNNGSYNFKEETILRMGERETNYLASLNLLSGDFNGDGYDDICLYEYDESRGFDLHTLINNHDDSFIEAPAGFSKLSVPADGKFIKIIAGDADGNGVDDLIWIAGVGKSLYRLTAININRSFNLLNLPDLESSGGIILAGDLNGDKFYDVCIKYPGGKRGGDTDIFLNRRDFTFASPYGGRRSFQGDYLFWCKDCNNDGFDDLIAKTGGAFVGGDWYILPNNLKADFYHESKQFIIDYRGN